MENTQQIKTTDRALRNKLHRVLASNNIDDKQFQGMVLLSGLSYDTATRLLSGDTNFSLATAAKVANLLGVDIDDLFDLAPKFN